MSQVSITDLLMMLIMNPDSMVKVQMPLVINTWMPFKIIPITIIKTCRTIRITPHNTLATQGIRMP